MYSSQTEYQRAGSVQEAVSLLAGNEDAKVLAGGHSLIPLMKLRLASPSLLVDIGQVDELNSGVTCNDGTISISSLTTHAAIASSDIVKSDSPMLAEAAGMVGDPAVRNRGTIGGNLAHSDPASDLPTVLTALGASINITGPGGSRVRECRWVHPGADGEQPRLGRDHHERRRPPRSRRTRGWRMRSSRTRRPGTP